MNRYLASLESLAEKYSLSSLYVFGSRADEIKMVVIGSGSINAENRSDIDIGVKLKPGCTLKASSRAEIAMALEDIFDAGRIDLVLIHEAPPFLALDIIKGELLYCVDPKEQAEDELFILRRAGDLAPFERERREMLLKGK